MPPFPPLEFTLPHFELPPTSSDVASNLSQPDYLPVENDIPPANSHHFTSFSFLPLPTASPQCSLVPQNPASIQGTSTSGMLNVLTYGSTTLQHSFNFPNTSSNFSPSIESSITQLMKYHAASQSPSMISSTSFPQSLYPTSTTHYQSTSHMLPATSNISSQISYANRFNSDIATSFVSPNTLPTVASASTYNANHLSSSPLPYPRRYSAFRRVSAGEITPSLVPLQFATTFDFDLQGMKSSSLANSPSTSSPSATEIGPSSALFSTSSKPSAFPSPDSNFHSSKVSRRPPTIGYDASPIAPARLAKPPSPQLLPLTQEEPTDRERINRRNVLPDRSEQRSQQTFAVPVLSKQVPNGLGTFAMNSCTTRIQSQHHEQWVSEVQARPSESQQTLSSSQLARRFSSPLSPSMQQKAAQALLQAIYSADPQTPTENAQSGHVRFRSLVKGNISISGTSIPHFHLVQACRGTCSV